MPIAPHLCLAQALVLPASTEIGLRVSTPHRLVLSIDGHINLELSAGTRLTVRQSPYQTHFLRIHPEANFYATLEKKLKGKRNDIPGRKSQN